MGGGSSGEDDEGGDGEDGSVVVGKDIGNNNGRRSGSRWDGVRDTRDKVQNLNSVAEREKDAWHVVDCEKW